MAKILYVNDLVKTSRAIKFIEETKLTDCLPISLISCRLNNKTLPIICKAGLASNTHVFVNNSMLKDFKETYPTVNFYPREEFIQSGDFKGIENTPGGARILSFRGMKAMGFHRIISCDDDLSGIQLAVPIYETTGFYRTRVLKTAFFKENNINRFALASAVVSRVANIAFDYRKDSIFGDVRYQGMYQKYVSDAIEYPGCLFTHSDYFFIDLDRVGAILDLIEHDNQLDIEMLKMFEDQWYGLLTLSSGHMQWKTGVVNKDKNHFAFVTENRGRTNHGLKDLMPLLKTDKRVKDFMNSDRMVISVPNKKTVNKDYTCISSRNMAKLYESVTGKKAERLDLIQYYPEVNEVYDMEKYISTDKVKVVLQ